MEELMLSQQTVKELGEIRVETYHSLTFPTTSAGADLKGDRIRLKNLIAQAQSALVERGMRSPDAERLLAPAAVLLELRQFWAASKGGAYSIFCPTNTFSCGWISR